MAPEPKNAILFCSGKIIQLKTDTKNAGRVHVLLDNGLGFHVSLVEAASLKSGQVLSTEQVQQYYLEDQFRKARADALAFLSYRERSCKESRAHLLKKGYAKSTVDRVLKNLKEENYLDDDRFCALWIQSRQRTQPKGAYALRYELRQKGIVDEMIQRHVSQIDEQGAAWDAVQPRLKRWNGLDRRQFVIKAGGFLQRRGFGSSIVRITIERGWNSVSKKTSETPDDTI